MPTTDASGWFVPQCPGCHGRGVQTLASGETVVCSICGGCGRWQQPRPAAEYPAICQQTRQEANAADMLAIRTCTR